MYICLYSLDDEVHQRSASPHTGSDGARISSVFRCKRVGRGKEDYNKTCLENIFKCKRKNETNFPINLKLINIKYVTISQDVETYINRTIKDVRTT